jgi:hypothetical protein
MNLTGVQLNKNMSLVRRDSGYRFVSFVSFVPSW